MNTRFQEEPNLADEWEDSLQSSFNCVDLENISTKKRSPQESLDRMAREISKIPIVNTFGPGETPAVGSPRKIQQQLEVQRVYAVRIPIEGSFEDSYSPFGQLKMFMYCLSIYPQSHWTKRCTSVTFREDH